MKSMATVGAKVSLARAGWRLRSPLESNVHPYDRALSMGKYKCRIMQ
jgi:hypothetical protein